MSPWWFFVLTLVIEFPIIFLFYHKDWKEVIIPFLLLNLFTWPLLHFVLFSTDLPLPILEIGVALAEMIGYKLLMKSNWKKSATASFLANCVSYGAGILISKIFL